MCYISFFFEWMFPAYCSVEGEQDNSNVIYERWAYFWADLVSTGLTRHWEQITAATYWVAHLNSSLVNPQILQAIFVI